MSRRLLAAAFLFLGLAARLPAEALSGRVVDSGGAPVAGARVRVTQAAAVRTAITSEDGTFSVELPGPNPTRLAVEAAGFARREVSAQPGREIRIALRRAVAEAVTVTATRIPARRGDVPESLVVVDSAAIEATAAPALDAALRAVPGFSLFRRTDSRFANPTAQGVSLRGLGASGASRALVLDDGTPLNDPFGGWVTWARVPRAAIDRIEVDSSGGSDLYGSPAIAGVVNLVRRTDPAPALRAEAAAGSEQSADGSAFARVSAGRWLATAAADGFTTDGYVPVPADERGPVDSRVSSRHESADVTIENSPSEAARWFARGSYFDESRHNGTPLQRNDTLIRQADAGADGTALGGGYQLRLFAGGQELDQTFSSIAADRGSETLTRAQRVPASSFGGSAQWSQPLFGARHTLVAGVDLRDVLGESAEDVFVGPLVFAAGRGRQRSWGLYAEDVVAAGERVTVQAGVRFDGWRNFDGREIALRHDPTQNTRTDLPPRSETAWSPRLGAVVRASERISLAASAHRGFRAPTLNELYRSFRVGNVQTEANPDLRAERSTGGEIGASYAGSDLSARVTLFAVSVDHPVANVTLTSTPSLITRLRENAGRTRTLGAQLDAEARLSPEWEATAGYLGCDSRVVRFPADPEIENRQLPQVPRRQVLLGLTWRGRPATAALFARWVSAQFDDDRNQLRLRPFFTLDATAARPIFSGFEAFLAVENLLGRQYQTGRTPVVTLGPPRLFRAGLRIRL